MDIEFNNAASLDTNNTGWFVGFSEWAKAGIPDHADLRHMGQEVRSHTLCIKWKFHPAGDLLGAAKPPSEGRSLSILVSEQGRFRLQFSENGNFPQMRTIEHVLQKHGDFVVWGENLHHRWFVDEACTILTLRWVPETDPA